MKYFALVFTAASMLFLSVPVAADLQSLHLVEEWAVTCVDADNDAISFERNGDYIISSEWQDKRFKIKDSTADLGISWVHGFVETKKGKRGLLRRLAFQGNQATLTSFSVVRDAVSNALDSHFSDCQQTK